MHFTSRPSPQAPLATLIVLTALGALTAFAVAGCSKGERTLNFESQLSAERTMAISPRTSLGGQLVFTEMIYQPGGTAAIGRSQGSCTRTAPGNGDVYECLITFMLPSGQLYAEAASSHDGPGSGVVTGGSGSYNGSRGTFLFMATRNARVKLAFSLTS